MTESVEKDCPVARQLLGPNESRELIGEGIVWSVEAEEDLDDNPDISQELYITLCDLRFKVKGSLHSQSKVKTIAAVDTEKVKSVEEFVEYACTQNRMQRGIEFLKESGVALERQAIGTFIKWVISDIIKEELDTMTASGIEPREINGSVSIKARNFIVNLI